MTLYELLAAIGAQIEYEVHSYMDGEVQDVYVNVIPDAAACAEPYVYLDLEVV